VRCDSPPEAAIEEPGSKQEQHGFHAEPSVIRPPIADEVEIVNIRLLGRRPGSRNAVGGGERAIGDPSRAHQLDFRGTSSPRPGRQ